MKMLYHKKEKEFLKKKSQLEPNPPIHKYNKKPCDRTKINHKGFTTYQI